MHFNLSWEKAKQYEYFVLTAKHVILESDKVYRINLEYAEALPVHHENNYGTFKVRDKVFIDEIKPFQDRVWSMEFFEAFIATEGLIDEMLVMFGGICKAEVLHYRKQEPVAGWSSIYSEYWLPKLVQDDTTISKKLDHEADYIETNGLYAAQVEDQQNMTDIFRIPQVYNTSGDSQYVVSKRVMEYWFLKGIKNSFFLQPLLIAGSELYKAYLELWQEVKLALSVNPNNKIV